MTRQSYIILAFIVIGVATLLGLAIPSAQSHGDPTCTLRTGQSVAPSAKAAPFAGGDTPSTSTVAAAPSTSCQ
jgi:hypothetical protein